MKQNLKKDNAITIISLVVTIIVLIILAGVSINLILGQDGIITKAREAKQNMELAAEEEARSLNELYAQMSGESSGSNSNDENSKLIEFKKQIASALTDIGIATAENADANTMASNIRSLSGASSADKVTYDNTNSGLRSTNLQGAVDELDTEISSLNNSLMGFPDYTNVLATITTQGASYTTTQNAYLIGQVSQSTKGMTAVVYVDGVDVGSISSDSISANTIFVPVYKGSTITTRASQGVYSLKVYGIKK